MRIFRFLILACLISACAAKHSSSVSPGQVMQPLRALAKLEAPFVQGSQTPLDFAFALAGTKQFRFEILDPLLMQTVLALGSDGQKAWWWEQGHQRFLSPKKLERVLQKRMKARLSLAELTALLRGELIQLKDARLHAELLHDGKSSTGQHLQSIRLFRQQQLVFELHIKEWNATTQLDPQLFSAYE